MTEHQDDIPGPEDTTEEAISPAPSPRSSADPLIGTKIGSCTLKRIIGSGGMGTVYEAVPMRHLNQTHATINHENINKYSFNFTA